MIKPPDITLADVIGIGNMYILVSNVAPKKSFYDFLKCINTTTLYAIFVYTAGHLQKNDYVVATERHCSTLSIDKNI